MLLLLFLSEGVFAIDRDKEIIVKTSKDPFMDFVGKTKLGEMEFSFKTQEFTYPLPPACQYGGGYVIQVESGGYTKQICFLFSGTTYWPYTNATLVGGSWVTN